MLTRLILGTAIDPYYNLAVEDWLFHDAYPGATLYLWQNAHTVVIGKNQCAYTECRLEELTRDGGKLARRTTGGGAVYHDLGNLNFSFVLPRERFDIPRQQGVIRAALTAFGISCTASGRNDLVLDSGEKFSGNAFREGDGRKLHHGTLLVNSDLQRLGQYLTPPKEKLAAKGVTSVRARVKNLVLCNPALTIDGLKEALAAAFFSEYGMGATCMDHQLEQAPIEKARLWLSSDAWRLGKLPAYERRLNHRFSFGSLEFLFSLNGTSIASLTVYGDVMDPSLPERLQEALAGCSYDPAAMASRIRSLAIGEGAELAAFFEGLDA